MIYDHLDFNGGFHSHGRSPIAGCFVMANPNRKWMMTGGSPMTQETRQMWKIACPAGCHIEIVVVSR